MEALNKLTAELDEFEAFVENYTGQMNDILTGKLPDADKQWAKQQLESIHSATVDMKALDNVAAESAEPVSGVAGKILMSGSRADKEGSKTKEISNDEKAKAEAAQHRADGNAFFKQKKYADAVSAYTLALAAAARRKVQPSHSDTTDPSDDTAITLYTNRALAHFRLGAYTLCVADCTYALELNPRCSKALWRRAEAYRALRQYEQAKKDAFALQGLIDDFAGLTSRMGQLRKDRANVTDPGVSEAEVRGLLAVLERELADESEEKKLKEELTADGSFTVLQELVTAFAETLRAIAGSPPNSTNKAHAAAHASSTRLTRLVEASPLVADAFRATNAYPILLSDTAVLTPTSIDLILPVMGASARTSSVNRRALAKHVGAIVNTMMRMQSPRVETVETAVEVLRLVVREEEGVRAVCGMANSDGDTQVDGKAFGKLVLKFLHEASTTKLVVEALLEFLTRVVKEGPAGWRAVSVAWGLGPEKLLGELPSYLRVDKANLAEEQKADDSKADDKKPRHDPAVVTNACLLIDALAGSPKAAAAAFSQHYKSLLDAMWTNLTVYLPTPERTPQTPTPTSTSPTSTSNPDLVSVLLATTHNALLNLPTDDDAQKIIAALLRRHAIHVRLVHVLIAQPKATDTPSATHTHLTTLALRVLTRLLASHRDDIISTLDGWWDDVPMLQLIQQHHQQQALSLQLLAAWLASGESKAVEWRKMGGFEALVGVLERARGVKPAERDEKILGNAALCVGECAKTATSAKQLHRLGATTHIVHLLRDDTIRDLKAKKNLAIACARLCQCRKWPLA
ncbi:uncharacterized protein EV422DRAFT_315663 [Fimicolochytrium jonesii]|uniref:uncharacterized protein n=1 Tax=Fimicolochytrium jonesii TaxID=1396493 RepID=UPI0022FF2057|nr:uncharacterized protein EV422DRAFT_315663 [Fimicolochytrium jonesii]KAI8824300.1 hypothetical protein EV422DRAFT_315663 [Fimicolochytrium jonesii]